MKYLNIKITEKDLNLLLSILDFSKKDYSNKIKKDINKVYNKLNKIYMKIPLYKKDCKEVKKINEI